jgi:hypothetical protein
MNEFEAPKPEAFDWLSPTSVDRADLEALAAYAPQIVKSDALRDVVSERMRQVIGEGFGPEHDDAQKGGSLAAAAGCYALFTDAYPNIEEPPPAWPWGAKWWKPFEYRRDLVRAAALIIAEIERLDRAEAKAVQP